MDRHLHLQNMPISVFSSLLSIFETRSQRIQYLLSIWEQTIQFRNLWRQYFFEETTKLKNMFLSFKIGQKQSPEALGFRKSRFSNTLQFS